MPAAPVINTTLPENAELIPVLLSDERSPMLRSAVNRENINACGQFRLDQSCCLRIMPVVDKSV